MNYNVLYYFLKSYGSLFVIIRSKPDNYNYSKILKIYRNYIRPNLVVEDLNSIKNTIDKLICFDSDHKEYFKENLNIYDKLEGVSDIAKFTKFSYVLINFTDKLVEIINEKDIEKIHDIADAAHNFPDFLMNDLWTIEEYYTIYIKPYNKKWKDNFLIEFEKKNVLKLLMEILKRIFTRKG